MPYAVEIKKDAKKALAKVPAKIRAQIQEKIEQLAQNPRFGSEKLEGFDSRFRFRQGDYRVIFEIEDDRLVVTVIKVGRRGAVYKAGGG